jgi:hypothetical protein
VEPIQDYLHAVAANLLRNAPLSQEKMDCAWQIAVGPAIGRVSSVTAGPDGTVRVTVQDTRWKNEIGKGRDLILKRLRDALGPDVARRLVVVSGGSRQSSRSPRRQGSA